MRKRLVKKYSKEQETIFEILDKRYDYWELKNENGIYIVTLCLLNLVLLIKQI